MRKCNPNLNQKLVPIAEAMTDEDWNPSEKEATEAMWEILDEFSLDELEQYKLNSDATRD
jgi:hypothetical protein